MRHPFFPPGHRSRWPHFDNRGPDYYYDDDPWDGRGSAGRSGAFPHPGRPGDGYRNESDIYEDDFEDRGPYRRSYEDEYRDHWPEDEFYEHRREMLVYRDPSYRGRGNLPWHRSRGANREYRPPFPEDNHEHSYGRDIYGSNANRGYHGTRRYRYEY